MGGFSKLLWTFNCLKIYFRCLISQRTCTLMSRLNSCRSRWMCRILEWWLTCSGTTLMKTSETGKKMKEDAATFSAGNNSKNFLRSSTSISFAEAIRSWRTATAFLASTSNSWLFSVPKTTVETSTMMLQSWMWTKIWCASSSPSRETRKQPKVKNKGAKRPIISEV